LEEDDDEEPQKPGKPFRPFTAKAKPSRPSSKKKRINTDKILSRPSSAAFLNSLTTKNALLSVYARPPAVLPLPPKKQGKKHRKRLQTPTTLAQSQSQRAFRPISSSTAPPTADSKVLFESGRPIRPRKEEDNNSEVMISPGTGVEEAKE